MAAPSFERAVSHVLKSEGGLSDHKADPGGATNRGITRATLGRWRGRPATRDEVMALTEVEAKQIYRKFYWDRVKGDDLPAGVDLAVFDFGVNSGNERAAKYLQALVGVPADGIIGPATIKAVNKLEPAFVVRELMRRRLDYLAKLSTWPVFGKGWRRRVLSVETEALDMIGNPMAAIPPPPDIPAPEPSAEPASSGLFVALAAVIVRIFRKEA